MTRAELTELIRNHEHSVVEFKRDSISADRLAAEMAALLNRDGGHILLGVEDDQTVSGLTRGMGVRNKLIPGMMAHNGTEPDLIEEEYRFIVRLWKEANARER